MKLPTFNNRELLPIRLIPCVLGFNLSPLDLAKLLAHKVGLAWPALRPEDELFAYHLDNEDFPVKMLPHEWGNFVSDIEVEARKFKLQETFEDENYRPWRLEALKLLPARVFVWKDEFEAVFQASFNRNGRIYTENANVGTKVLSFNPFIEPQYLPLVWEGFESLCLDSPTDNRTIQFKNRGGVEMRSKIRVGFADFIRLFAITDLEHWESGLRVAPDGVWVVPTLVNYLFPEELAFINEHPEKDLTKAALSFPCSLSQLESFIEWGGLSGYFDPADLNNFIQKEIGKLLSTENVSSVSDVKTLILLKDDPTAEKIGIVQPTKTVSRRSDLLSEEITAAVEELGGDCTPDRVMKKLKEYAGKEGSCIVAVIPGGFTWLGRMRVKKDLDLEGLRKRLARKAAVKPPLGR